MTYHSRGDGEVTCRFNAATEPFSESESALPLADSDTVEANWLQPQRLAFLRLNRLIFCLVLLTGTTRYVSVTVCPLHATWLFASMSFSPSMTYGKQVADQVIPPPRPRPTTLTPRLIYVRFRGPLKPTGRLSQKRCASILIP